MSIPAVSGGQIRLGLVLPTSGTAQETLELARFAEEIGLDSLWMFENLYTHGAFSTMGAVAAITSRVRLGIGTVSPFTRSPVILAMEAAQLQAISGGRFQLGLGASPATQVRRMGVDPAKPLTAMREALTIINGLLANQTVSLDGQRFPIDGVKLGFQAPEQRPPLFIGAIGDKMLHLTGAAADGILFSTKTPVPFVKRAMGLIAEGAQSAGRTLDEIDSVLYAPFAMLDDEHAACNRLKPYLATSLERAAANPELARLYTADNVIPPEQLREIGRRLAAGESPETAIPDDVVQVICVAGAEATCRARFEEYQRAGVREIVLFGVGTDQTAREMLIRAARMRAPVR